MTRMTINGVSTTTERGSEQYENFRVGRKTYCQYDYRHTDGELFSVVRTTLEQCREARDKWLDNKSIN